MLTSSRIYHFLCVLLFHHSRKTTDVLPELTENLMLTLSWTLFKWALSSFAWCSGLLIHTMFVDLDLFQGHGCVRNIRLQIVFIGVRYGSYAYDPRREAGDVLCPPLSGISGLSFDSTLLSPLFVLLPSPVTLSVLSFSVCWSFLLNFF